MANIIPPEFFGLYGLGESLKGAGQTIQQQQAQKRARSMEELELELALNPNNRQAILESAEASGLLPPGSAANYQPTIDEMLTDPNFDMNTLSDPMRLLANQRLGLQPGETIEQARRRVEAQTRGAEQGVELGDLQLLEAEAAQQRRQQYESALNTDWFREMAGVEEGTEITPGSLEAMRLGQQLTSADLQNTIDAAQARYADPMELAKLRRLQADTRRIEFQLRQAQAEGVDEGTLAWMKDVSLSTGMNPSLIRQAMDRDSDMGIADETQREALRNSVIDRIAEYQESRQSTIRKAIRENTSEAVIRAREIYELNKATEGSFLPPNHPFWVELGVDVMNELGVPAALEPATEGFWWWENNPARALLGTEARSYMEQLGDMVGADTTSEAPSIDQDGANTLAPELVNQYGSVQAAIEAVQGNEAITQPNKEVMISALNTLAGSDPTPEGATSETTTPTGPEPVENPQSVEDWDRQIDYLQQREKDERQAQASISNPRDRDLSALREIRAELERAKMERRRVNAREAVRRRGGSSTTTPRR